MLEVSDLHVARGATHVLKGVSLELRAGEIVALIGGNGAGKTTTLLTISGLLRPRAGSITFRAKDGAAHDLAKLGAEQIVRSGIVHCPEGRQVFASLSVAENLKAGAYTRRDSDGVRADLSWLYDLFPILAERRQQMAGKLSGGEQMMLSIARALLARPQVLLLDEPSLGLAPQAVETIFEIIEQLIGRGVTILLVEQNAQMALEIANRGYVLENGAIANTGTGRDLAADPNVKKAYLGMTQ